MSGKTILNTLAAGAWAAASVVAFFFVAHTTFAGLGVIGLMINEGYLADVALIYAMISFLAVVLLCKVYMGVFLERRARSQEEGKDA